MFCSSASPALTGWFTQNCIPKFQRACSYSNSRQTAKDSPATNETKLANSFNLLPSYIDRMLPNCCVIQNSLEVKINTLPAFNKTYQSLLLTSDLKFYKYQKRWFRSRRLIKKAEEVSEPASKDWNISKLLHKTNDKKLEKIQELIEKYNIDPKQAASMSLGYEAGKESAGKKNLINFILLCVSLFIGYSLLSISWSSKKGVFGVMKSQQYLVENPDVTFNDVRGIEEVKEELEQIVSFLKEPNRYLDLGGKLPKGILLVGSPGTGKTLLAKAIAGEAQVPFFYASGAEFDEMFVGVGSSRIRNLFKAARENAPCIIFIDEIDACGNKRSDTEISPYARQTINQLLQELDGFKSSEGVIVLGATNSVEVLDKALRRPGRFDTEIHVLKPDITGRKEILQLYIDKTVHVENIKLDNLASLTAGMTGADLANLVNQAAIRAAQVGKTKMTLSDLEFALDKLRMGIETKGRVRSAEEIRNTAFHEAGHALAAFYDEHANTIFKATIRQRGGALGHVSYIPKSENQQTKEQLMSHINVAMAGRVAEEIIFGESNITTGASSDLKMATNAAEEMLLKFGMGKMGYKVHSKDDMSEAAKHEMESEVKSLLMSSYKKMKELLLTRKNEHHLLAEALIKYETLTQPEITLIFETKDVNSVEEKRRKLLPQAPIATPKSPVDSVLDYISS